MKKKISKFKSTPSYNLYIKLRFTLDTYLTTRIDTYIFFEYYKWDIPESILMQSIQMDINKNDIYILKNIMEYDYQVFKVILFLYWDLEYFLEGLDYVKNSLMVSMINSKFFKTKFSNNNIKKFKEYLEKIINKNSSYFWANIEMYGLLDKIFKYDFFFNFDLRYKNINYIKKYKKYNDKIVFELATLKSRLYCLKKKKINLLYYESFIDKWYKEWALELGKKKTVKYKKKLGS